LAPLTKIPECAGFFVWRTYADPGDVSQEAEWGFSPRGKLAELILRDAFTASWAADGAIGFAPFAFLKDVRAAAIAMPCGKIAAPTPFAVKAEEYPLQRRLFLYTRGWPENPEAAGLLDFALSDAAQPVIDRTGFVDQSLLRQGAADFSDHLIFAMQSAGSRAEIDATKRFAQVTRDRVRLSSTFRFRTGGERLDAKAVADAGRLARWLEQPANAAVEILLIGFSDSVGGYNNNLRLSQARADAIRRAVLVQVGPDFDPNRVKTEAFATVAPVACNEIESGRASNRRVEAWVNR
ncbi:MAG: OmpA family protein, partial [Pseudomonadota bacterium]